MSDLNSQPIFNFKNMNNKYNPDQEKKNPETDDNTAIEIEDNSTSESETGNENTSGKNDDAGKTEEVTSESDLQKELDTQKDKYLRLFAEFDNYKKRTAKEIWEIRQTASVDVINSLLDVLDDIDRAEGQLQKDPGKDKMPEGVQLIFNKFRKILEQKGLKSIETLNSEFDIEKDEAVSEIPVDDKLKGKVVAEVQKGYTLNGKLIRFAKVVVGK